MATPMHSATDLPTSLRGPPHHNKGSMGSSVSSVLWVMVFDLMQQLQGGPGAHMLKGSSHFSCWWDVGLSVLPVRTASYMHDLITVLLNAVHHTNLWDCVHQGS